MSTLIDCSQVEALDSSTLKKMLVSFEKKVKKNQEMRIKYSDNPEKYGMHCSQSFVLKDEAFFQSLCCIFQLFYSLNKSPLQFLMCTTCFS